MLKFPDNFLWGSAASAPQTEGHSLKNGKSPSTWDQWFLLNPEKFNANQGPEDTSNVYEVYREDVQRMAEIGMNSYRTSIAWTRLLPDGKTVNPEAVAFYRDYFQTLLDHQIQPIMNLFHFDMPWWLMEKGGWETRESVDAFAFYAKVAFENFGDLIHKWTTFNEPLVHIEAGYLQEFHYPAISDMKRAMQVGYHTLMAHFSAVKTFRETGLAGEIGIILNVTPAYARSNSSEDLQAKEYADLFTIKSFLDPCILGEIPAKLIDLIKANDLTPTTLAEDKQLIKDYPIDFLGMNYYQPMRVQAPTNAKVPAESMEDLFAPYDWPEKRMNPYRGWEIYPEALYDVAMMIKNEYHNIPWYVSENGMGVAEEERFMDEHGMIQDDYRIEFMQEHLAQLHKGISEGSNCFGYHTWTFVDCWSWLNGYRNRYGFYRVDLDNNFARSLKKSGLWYKELSQNNGF
ncbi:6-phospho-beta-glucosidase [Enterococcus sp. PF1-24]|uniref:glycoside hydrolase family 1 protein n=1 Tax=unclassified Enterococcus TaxID=2608891 RepID=UPI002473776D|nr:MULTISPECIES: glycoside hydrolase family 1 protein [unclassified Enterococcus]MDH6365180.1 6-phospho-beta-glucosidase [Enterococcus sp. PFB1-1]MDH6402236.1 6-phospho-beta-glucosidase [Enterococcus sp. PF1-24]